MCRFFFKLFLLITFLFLSSSALLAQVNWTKYEGNPVITVPGAWYNGVIATCVIYNPDSSRYEMFFSGSTTADGGRPCRIGLAYSNEGLSWQVRSTPVLTPSAGQWDSYTAEFPNVLYENGVYKMWYTGAMNTATYKIGYATSPDGINWIKHPTPVLEAGTALWDAGGVGGSYVMPVTGGYKMWYNGINSSWTRECIGYATSIDGILWQKDTQNSPILEPGVSGEWDDTWVAKPSVLFKDNIYYMWYIGMGSRTGPFRIGLATSPNGINNWTKHPANPVLRPSASGWDGGEVESPSVILVGDTLYMYYDGSVPNNFVWQIGLAKSLYAPLPLPPGTYTVGTGGNFATIQDAFNKLQTDGVAGNVTLELIDELYTAPTDSFGFKLNGPIPGAGPNSRVTIKPAANKNVILEGIGFRVMALINTSYITIDGVGLNGATTMTFHSLYNALFSWNDCLVLLYDSDNNIVQNITFIDEDVYRLGISIWLGSNTSAAPDSNLIYNNFVKKGTAMYLNAMAGGSVRPEGNIIRGNFIGSESNSLISWGIQVERCKNTIVENNYVQNIKIMNTTGEQIILGINSYSGSGDIIRNNVVYNLRASSGWSSVGILLSGGSGSNCMVYNNMVYDIQSSSASTDSRVSGIQILNQINPKIYYNTVWLSGSGANRLGSAALYVSDVFGTSTGVDIRNNIFINTRDEGQYCASAIYDYSAANLTSDYNDLYYETNQYNCLVRIGNTKYNTLPNWQATGKDINSYNEMPLFDSPYLHIDWNYATMIDGRAIPITGITTDFDGEPRNAQTPDIGADEGVVVPVELTSFTASALGSDVVLNWSTATELNNYGFEIQRKALGGEFATVAFVKGQGTTTQPNQYSFADKNLDEGKYFYRLKQMDYGGQYSYSQAVEVDVRMLNKYSLEQNYPNPFNPVTTIGYVLQEKGNAKLTLLNSLGEEIAVLVNEEQDKGYHKVDVDATKLTSGVYFYQLRSGSFVETKKMILLR